MLMHTRQSQQRSVSFAEHVWRHHSVVSDKGKRSEVANRACACAEAVEHSVCLAVLYNFAMLKQALSQLHSCAMLM